MAHFPIPGSGRRLTLAAVQSLGFAAALFALLVFLARGCTATGTVLPVLSSAAPGLPEFAPLVLAFALFFVPAGFFGPGRREHRFKQAGFATLLIGIVVFLAMLSAPDCAARPAPVNASLVVLAIAAVIAAALFIWVAVARPEDPKLESGGPKARRTARFDYGKSR